MSFKILSAVGTVLILGAIAQPAMASRSAVESIQESPILTQEQKDQLIRRVTGPQGNAVDDRHSASPREQAESICAQMVGAGQIPVNLFGDCVRGLVGSSGVGVQVAIAIPEEPTTVSREDVEQEFDHRGSGRVEAQEEGDRALKGRNNCFDQSRATDKARCSLGGIASNYGDDPTMEGHEGTPERTQGSGTRMVSIGDDVQASSEMEKFCEALLAQGDIQGYHDCMMRLGSLLPLEQVAIASLN